MAKRWTKEELEYLQNNYKHSKIKQIAKKLGRTEGAIGERAYFLGIGKWQENLGYLVSSKAGKLIGKDSRTLEKAGLKFKREGKLKVIELESFIKWLKNNQDKWDSRKLEEYGLGVEPEWLREKRKRDFIKPSFNKSWTKKETDLLIAGYIADKSFRELAESLNRSEGAIRSKISKLKVANKLPKNKIILRWSDEETNMLLELEKNNLTDEEIAYELGRDALHITDRRRNLRNKGLYIGKKGEYKCLYEIVGKEQSLKQEQ